LYKVPLKLTVGAGYKHL